MYCDNRQDSLYSKLQGIARNADTRTEIGLQNLVSDTCLAMLRSNQDWIAGRTESSLKGLLTNDVEVRVRFASQLLTSGASEEKGGDEYGDSHDPKE